MNGKRNVSVAIHTRWTRGQTQEKRSETIAASHLDLVRNCDKVPKPELGEIHQGQSKSDSSWNLRLYKNGVLKYKDLIWDQISGITWKGEY